MAKTVTMRIDNNIYELFKAAANGERRTISNFLEFAALNYLTNDILVSDEEMEEIINNKKLLSGLKKGLEEIKKGKYRIVN